MSEKDDDKLLVKKKTLNLRRKYGRTKQISIVERDAFIPPGLEDDIKEYILKKNSVTATDLAVKFDIRVSTAKALLQDYEEAGLIKLYDPRLTINIYVPTSK
ncbi:MAG: hypothetical protein EU544_02950 [Promethearchaeota archaeon]|nr:MAG: hypothetical protein EU544_02950 [Candidatus Lokiarchaeota archaeon]